MTSALSPSNPGGVEAIVRLYLSQDYRDRPDEGCPSAALLNEIARGTPAAKQSRTDGLLAVVDAVAAAAAPHHPPLARQTVLDAFCHDGWCTADLTRGRRPRPL